MAVSETFTAELGAWIEREELAHQAIPIIGQLWLKRGVEPLLFRRSLVNQSPLDLLQHHRYARELLGREMHIQETLPILRALTELALQPSRLDVGRLVLEWQENLGSYPSIEAFLRSELAEALDKRNASYPSRDVVLYGFGRIGRLLARELINSAGHGNDLRLRAIVVRGNGNAADLHKRAGLLLQDSVHGPFKGTIDVLEAQSALLVNGHLIQVIYSNSPSEVDYTAYGIDDALIIDNTGKWRDRESLSQHLQAKGTSLVLLTAPGKGDIPNVVYGINHDDIPSDETIYAAASCTTNAISPAMKVISDHFGIDHGHVETVHSYTNDQNLLDNFHAKQRRGRGAPLNMVITETGASSAISKVLPQLAGKITGSAVRVPTPNVSLAILNLHLTRPTNKEDLNQLLRKSSLMGKLVAQIDYSADAEIVSSDLIGNSHTTIIDSLATIVEGHKAVVYAWYDNEFGYSCQVARLARKIAGVDKFRYY
ncbi:MAG: glyceraldehyde-3-phosphate dehydrogenase [Candidatus Sericytochromatia bacterium]|nr:glyceraldehyde-3-phosphate dehydrogenase [Candidatus Sericytochromatia bacterium]